MENRGHHINGCIEFEVAVVDMQKAEGGIKLYVIKAEGKYASENVTKIKFKIEKDLEPIQVFTEKDDWSKVFF